MGATPPNVAPVQVCRDDAGVYQGHQACDTQGDKGEGLPRTTPIRIHDALCLWHL